jgi:hypothetical protein
MKKLQILLFLTLLPVLAWGQQKEFLMNLPAGEELDLDNSIILPTTTGADYEITTQTDDYSGTYFLYTRSVSKKPIAVDTRLGEFITTGKEGGQHYFRVNTTGKKYGPYKEIKARYNEEKKVLYAYSYTKDGKSYFEDLVNNKSYGPIDGGDLWYIDEKNLVYSYTEINSKTTKKETYLIENGKKSGPYEQVVYQKSVSATSPDLVIYKQNGKYFVRLKQYSDIAFASYPSVTEIKNGWVVEGKTDPSAKDKLIYLPDGRKLASSQNIKHLVNYNGEILKFEHLAGKGSHAAYKVYFKDKEIGTFAMKKSYRSDLKSTDFFNHILMKVDVTENNWSMAYEDVSYMYSSSKGLIGPFTKDEIRKTYYFSGGYASIKADSTLEMNGKKVLDNIIMTDFRDYPDWWAFQHRGDYVYPFRNGKEIPVSELPEKRNHYNTTDKPVIKVRRGDEYFLRVKGSEKLLGPVRKYDPFTISDDGKHYAVVNSQNDYVVVDGKQLTKGFNIVFNQHLNAFHWLDQVGDKIYLYTYKL